MPELSVTLNGESLRTVLGTVKILAHFPTAPWARPPVWLLVQQRHVQVAAGAPLAPRDVLQPRRREHEGGPAVGEGPDHPRSPADLAVEPLDGDGARLVFQVFADAYERQSVVITTNLEFSRWGGVFGDDQMAAAVIDRIVHHGRLVQFRGESYRVKHALMQEG